MSGSLGEGLFRLTHQIVSLRVDVERKLLEGFTELILMPLVEKSALIRCHCRQSKIQRILVNDIECDYQLLDPLADLTGSRAPGTPEYAEEKYAEALLTASKGELIITLPDAVSTFSLAQQKDPGERKPTVEEADRVDMSEGSDAEEDKDIQLSSMPQKEEKKTSEYQVIRVKIEYRLEDPASGAYFVLPDSQLCPKRPAYMFVWSSYSHARVWVPCFDYWQETTSWEIEFIVGNSNSVICNGELQEEIAMDGDNQGFKRFTYRMDVPCSASQISFAVGPFISLQESSAESITYDALQGNSRELAHTTEFMKKVTFLLQPRLCLSLELMCTLWYWAIYNNFAFFLAIRVCRPLL
jgi:hypothetical protein